MTFTRQEFVVPLYSLLVAVQEGSMGMVTPIQDSICENYSPVWMYDVGWPSYFESDNHHHTEASFQSQVGSMGFPDEMLALRLLQGRMTLEEMGCLEQWRNGAVSGLSGCHGRRPSSQVRQIRTKDDLFPGLGRRAAWAW